MTVPELEDFSHLTESLYWIEPVLEGRKVFAVAFTSGDVWLRTEDGAELSFGSMLQSARAELRALATDLEARTPGQWGDVVFSGYIVPLKMGGRDAHIVLRMATSLACAVLDQDTELQGVRSHRLETALKQGGYPTLAPVEHIFIGLPSEKSLNILPSVFGYWAERWGAKTLLLVERDGFDRSEDSISRYPFPIVPGAMLGWTCACGTYCFERKGPNARCRQCHRRQPSVTDTDDLI